MIYETSYCEARREYILIMTAVHLRTELCRGKAIKFTGHVCPTDTSQVKVMTMISKVQACQ